MANLDRLLKKVEKNVDANNEQKTYPLTIAGETFEVKTMTRSEKRDFYYTQDPSSSKNMGTIVKKMKPHIYRALNLAPLAVKAKDAGFISSNYDVVEALFEPEEILEIIGFITEINELTQKEAEGDIEEIKK